MFSICTNLVVRLLMVRLDVASSSRIASTLAAMVLTLAVRASRELVSEVSTILLLGGIVNNGLNWDAAQKVYKAQCRRSSWLRITYGVWVDGVWIV